MFDGDFPTTQCVAVITHSGSTNEPPQNCRPSRVLSNACQGQELMGATVPPTISVERICRIPQIAARIVRLQCLFLVVLEKGMDVRINACIPSYLSRSL